jgi:hypothetical protein
MKNDSATAENVYTVMSKFQDFPDDLKFPFVGVYPREMQTNVHAKICVQMLVHYS